MTPLLLIDEDCGICVATAAWIARRSSVVVLGNGSHEAAVQLRDLTPGARAGAVHHVDASGRRTSAGAAVVAALGDLPRWRWLARALGLAPAVTERAYRLVARHRARISVAVGLAACRLPGGGASDCARPDVVPARGRPVGASCGLSGSGPVAGAGRAPVAAACRTRTGRWRPGARRPRGDDPGRSWDAPGRSRRDVDTKP